MDFFKTSFLILVLCVLLSLKNLLAETGKGWFQRAQSSFNESLSYDYYRESCPLAEKIVRTTVRKQFYIQPEVAPALLRLMFHDCFVEGCDASVLLDNANGIASEKDSPPNESLKGFDVIDIIKLKVENACPGIVSCSDILVLAARESVLLAGGPFYPVFTGRRDSKVAFQEVATRELPSPFDDLSKTIKTFASRGFDERETVTLLGAHSTGAIHCKFLSHRLHNFNGTQGPDPSIDAKFLYFLRSRCNQSFSSFVSPSMSPLPSASTGRASVKKDAAIRMDYEGPGTGFGRVYYSSLLQGKGLLFVDQQLTAGEKTTTSVQAYASDASLFERDFGLTMYKLSNLQVLTAPMGEVRLNCSKVN